METSPEAEPTNLLERGGAGSLAVGSLAVGSQTAAHRRLLPRGGPARAGAGRAAGRAQRFPRPGPARPSAPGPGPPLRRRRHVLRGQRVRPAAPGGAAQAGGRRGEDQGLSGGCRASAVLHAECLQGCPAGRSSSGQQPLPGAQILCFTLKTGKKFAKETFRHGDE